MDQKKQKNAFVKHERQVKMLHIVTSGEAGEFPIKSGPLPTKSQKGNKMNVGQTEGLKCA